MKRMLFLLSALLLAAPAFTVAGDTGAARLIYKHNRIEAYSVVRPDGRRVIVATNVGTDPQKLAARKARPAAKVQRLRNTFLRPAPAGGAGSSAVQGPSDTGTAGQPPPAQLQNGIPVCIWHGMLVSPIQVNNRLVCPSENSAYPINP